MKPQPCAVKLTAERLGLPMHQPTRVKTGLAEWMRELAADLGVVLAYGRVLPGAVLAAPEHGCVNLHASLLPRYRGAAPIARALQHGEKVTGVSLMRMDEGLDTGPVYVQRHITIEDDWNHGDLTLAVAARCAQMVREDLGLVLTSEPEPQDSTRASLAPPIHAQETQLDWTRPAQDLHHDVRAFSPTPGAHTFNQGKRVRILSTRIVLDPDVAGRHRRLRARRRGSDSPRGGISRRLPGRVRRAV
jgi:methionyl-tRNA formyltransferase